MNSKKLYEHIMSSIAKQVKHILNEGAWGYSPDKSDDYLDECAVIGRQILKIIVGNFEKAINDKNITKIYDYMGIVVDYLRTEDLTGECMYWEDNEGLYTVVNKGSKNEEKRLNYGVKLNQLFKQAYEILNNDDNSMGWEDFDKFKRYLNGIKNQFDKMMYERKSDDFGKDSWHNKMDKIRDNRDKLFYKYIEVEKEKD